MGPWVWRAGCQTCHNRRQCSPAPRSPGRRSGSSACLTNRRTSNNVTVAAYLQVFVQLVLLLWRSIIYEEIDESIVNKSANRLYICAPKGGVVLLSVHIQPCWFEDQIYTLYVSHPPISFISQHLSDCHHDLKGVFHKIFWYFLLVSLVHAWSKQAPDYTTVHFPPDS